MSSDAFSVLRISPLPRHGRARRISPSRLILYAAKMPAASSRQSLTALFLASQRRASPSRDLSGALLPGLGDDTDVDGADTRHC